MKNTAARARLQHDMQEIQKTPGLETLNLTSSDGFDDKNQPIICWNMVHTPKMNRIFYIHVIASLTSGVFSFSGPPRCR